MSLLVSIVYKEFSIHILKENSSWLSTEPLKNSLRQIDISSDGIIRKILALSPVCLMIELIKIFIAPDISFTRDCSFWRLPQLKKGHKMLFLYSNLDKYHSFSIIFCNCLYVSVGYLVQLTMKNILLKNNQLKSGKRYLNIYAAETRIPDKEGTTYIQFNPATTNVKGQTCFNHYRRIEGGTAGLVPQHINQLVMPQLLH